jgi:hypothetical protein
MCSALFSKHARLGFLALGLSGGLLLLAAGLAAGLLLSGLIAPIPMHAVSTDRIDTFAMCTGPLDEGIEGVYTLDFLTGELRGAALSRQNGKFHAFYQGNVNVDLGIDATKNPRYMIVTGVADLVHTGGARIAPSKGIVYVAEITTGKVAAYFVKWSPAAHVNGTPIREHFILLDTFPMRTPAAPAGGGT